MKLKVQRSWDALRHLGLVLCVLSLSWQGPASRALGQAASNPAILQMYEARWNTIENRIADIFRVGYGQMWLPPPTRAGSSGSNVGYEVFDRFDLGSPGNHTLYGTEAGLKTTVAAGHGAGLRMYTDLVPNHNGFRTHDTPGFIEQGGYKGFALTLPNDPFGDFHDVNISVDQNPLNGSLLGLLDIAQEKRYTFIRQPVSAGDPNNIPAGTIYNRPDAKNARFYPDQDLGGQTLLDSNTPVTRFTFNEESPYDGDPVMETALQLLMRNVQWMVEVIGVDGFRVDAAKHMPAGVHLNFDQSAFRANPRLQLDGSIQPVFMFGEVYDSNRNLLQSLIRKDLPNPHAIEHSDTTVAGNRDVLDFPLFFALRDRLSNSNSQNNWNQIRASSMDTNDRPAGSPVWHTDGSQGVAFVQSHDDTAPFLANVAYAYTLLRPGNAIVYFNAREFGNNRGFPRNGKVDALGGFHGETITRLVELRNTHGRGDFQERSTSTEVYIYEREKSAVIALNNRTGSSGTGTGVDTRTNVQTAFSPGTVLVELTGNAANSLVDQGGVVPESIRVNASGQINVTVPRNSTHGLGYVIYGVASPQGTLSIDGTDGILPGVAPTSANNGTARQSSLDVVRDDTFTMRLRTTPVTLPAPAGEADPVRDVHADGDAAMFKIDSGRDFNGTPGIDETTPGNVNYGFEQFTQSHIPGYRYEGGNNVGTGFGLYEQTIDTTVLAEGRHYVTVRAFRHRDAATGGDGGPAVFTDFRRTIYVDRLPPEAEVVSFNPSAADPGNLNSRTLIARSADLTADNMHIFVDLPAGVPDADILPMALNGQGTTTVHDRDQWSRGFGGVTTGNHVATIVTFEPTYDGTHGFHVQRFTGLFTQTTVGAGLGDLNSNGQLEIADVIGTDGFEQILYSQNARFHAAADVTGDGLVDNRDLYALGAELVVKNASSAVLAEYDEALRRRADLDGNGTADVSDLEALRAQMGSDSWLYDLNVDGIVDPLDAYTFITELLRTKPGDFNLDGSVDAADYTVWRNDLTRTVPVLAADGDFDGDVDEQDYNVWKSDYGFQRSALVPTGTVSAVPEPNPLLMLILSLTASYAANRRSDVARRCERSKPSGLEL